MASSIPHREFHHEPQVRVERGEKLVWLGGTEKVLGSGKQQVSACEYILYGTDEQSDFACYRAIHAGA